VKSNQLDIYLQRSKASSLLQHIYCFFRAGWNSRPAVIVRESKDWTGVIPVPTVESGWKKKTRLQFDWCFHWGYSHWSM